MFVNKGVCELSCATVIEEESVNGIEHCETAEGAAQESERVSLERRRRPTR